MPKIYAIFTMGTSEDLSNVFLHLRRAIADKSYPDVHILL